MLCLAFPSTYQILQKHFQEPISLEGQFLHFSVSTIFCSLFFKSWYFSIIYFSSSSTLTSAGRAKSIIIFVCSFLSITIRSGQIVTMDICPTVPWSLHSLLLLLEEAHTTFHCELTRSFYKYPNEISLQHCCVVLYSFWADFSHPLAMCCTLSPFFPHCLSRWPSLVLSIWCFI